MEGECFENLCFGMFLLSKLAHMVLAMQRFARQPHLPGSLVCWVRTGLWRQGPQGSLRPLPSSQGAIPHGSPMLFPSSSTEFIQPVGP